MAFKWVCWVIKVDKMLLLSPSAHLRMAGVELTGFLDEDSSLVGINLDTLIADCMHYFGDYETKQIYNIIYYFSGCFAPSL